MRMSAWDYQTSYVLGTIIQCEWTPFSISLPSLSTDPTLVEELQLMQSGVPVMYARTLRWTHLSMAGNHQSCWGPALSQCFLSSNGTSSFLKIHSTQYTHEHKLHPKLNSRQLGLLHSFHHSTWNPAFTFQIFTLSIMLSSSCSQTYRNEVISGSCHRCLHRKSKPKLSIQSWSKPWIP